MIIDAHQHYWKLERGDYDWLTSDLANLYRDFMPDDLRPLLTANGVVGTIAVQAAATEAETLFLLELAKTNPTILGVVGWVDMEVPDAIARIDHLLDIGGGLLKGFRPMIQDIEDIDWILKPSLDPIFKALEERDLVFDALVLPKHLRNLEARLIKHPNLRVVIDHAGKPPIAQRSRSGWIAAMKRLAQLPNVYCKLSGLVTEADNEWREADIQPYINDIFKLFSPQRVIWGSDWPVLNIASNYDVWFDLARRNCESFDASARDGVFGKTAVECYQVKMPC